MTFKRLWKLTVPKVKIPSQRRHRARGNGRHHRPSPSAHSAVRIPLPNPSVSWRHNRSNEASHSVSQPQLLKNTSWFHSDRWAPCRRSNGRSRLLLRSWSSHEQDGHSRCTSLLWWSPANTTFKGMLLSSNQLAWLASPKESINARRISLQGRLAHKEGTPKMINLTH